MHDPTKVLMGTTPSTAKKVTNHLGSIAAGLVVRLKSDDTLSLLASDGSILGISLGKDLSDTNHTAIIREGLKVPLHLTDALEPDIGTQVFVSPTTGKAVASNAEGAVATNGVYASEVLTGIAESGSNISVALVDMAGGL